MTEKTIGYVELEWTCPKCGTKNPGSQRTCTACGAPQPTDVKFEQAQRQELVTDEEKLEEAQKGSDIHCPYCGTRNPADAAICSQCGGDLKSGEKRAAGRVVGAYKTTLEPARQIPCPNCNTLNLETNKTCTACGASLSAPVVEQAPVKLPAAKPSGGSKYLRIAIIAIAAIACLAVVAYFIINATKRQDLVGTVQGVNWVRLIPILELRDVTRQAFRDEIPQGAPVGSCTKRYHHTQPDPAPEATEVCGTPYTKDTGSGFGQVVQDCQYNVYQDYCDFVAQEWQTIDQVKLQGNDLNPAWPQVSLSGSQQEGERQESYTIVFSTDENETYSYTIVDPQEFARYQPGSEWVLVINGFNQLVAVEQK